jgi:predicted component of type VI protein secretion system
MPVKLQITNQTVDEERPAEYFYEQDRITIGRGTNNDLTLPDPKRIVSTEHAEIRCRDDTYQLVDRGSKNFTYLHDQRLESGRPYELQDGDAFRIGEFTILFRAIQVEERLDEEAQTVFAADFTNPFDEAADRLTKTLRDIIDTYEEEAPRRREDALRDAFRSADEHLSSHDAIQRVLQLLGVDPSQANSSRPSDPFKPSTSASSSESDVQETPVLSSSDCSDNDDNRPTPPRDGVADDVLNALLESLSRIIGIPWQFRHEFIGQTIMQSPRTRFIYDGDASTLKEHLMDPSISEEERQERLNLVTEKVEDLAVHQVSMVDGYKASVQSGTEALLRQLDPDAHQSDLLEETPIYQYAPILASPDVLDRLRREWRELQRGDWSAAEQRIFRPAFIKAYLARMTAVQSSGDSFSF